MKIVHSHETDVCCTRRTEKQRKVLGVWKQSEHKMNFVSEKWTNTVRKRNNCRDRTKMWKYNAKMSTAVTAKR